tara:strand:+ start:150 stop:824 length:675 start_codon:yes stop_codon:yes gene_type:complete
LGTHQFFFPFLFFPFLIRIRCIDPTTGSSVATSQHIVEGNQVTITHATLAPLVLLPGDEFTLSSCATSDAKLAQRFVVTSVTSATEVVANAVGGLSLTDETLTEVCDLDIGLGCYCPSGPDEYLNLDDYGSSQKVYCKPGTDGLSDNLKDDDDRWWGKTFGNHFGHSQSGTFTTTTSGGSGLAFKMTNVAGAYGVIVTLGGTGYVCFYLLLSSSSSLHPMFLYL